VVARKVRLLRAAAQRQGLAFRSGPLAKFVLDVHIADETIESVLMRSHFRLPSLCRHGSSAQGAGGSDPASNPGVVDDHPVVIDGNGGREAAIQSIVANEVLADTRIPLPVGLHLEIGHRDPRRGQFH
jgi:hypothetical protein